MSFINSVISKVKSIGSTPVGKAIGTAASTALSSLNPITSSISGATSNPFKAPATQPVQQTVLPKIPATGTTAPVSLPGANYSLTPGQDKITQALGQTVKTPGVANAPVIDALRPPASTPASTPSTFSTQGYVSTDPNQQARIAEMQRQASASAVPEPPSSEPANTDNTPKTINAPASMPTANSVLDTLRGKITSLSTPSAEEQALQDELDQFKGSSAQDIAAKEGQGRGITVGLVRGQQQKEQTQANLQEQTLLDRIAAMSANRQAQLQAASNEFTMANAEQERQDKLTAPITAGGNILQFDPATGQYKTLYSAPAQAAEGFSLSAGQARYDAAGNLIAQGLADTSSSGGFSLSPGQTRYDANGNVIASGGAATPTAEQYKAYGFATRMDNSSKIIDDLDQKFTGALGQGISFMPEFLKSDDRKSIEQAESDFVNALLRRESGAAISPAEFNSAQKQYFPQAGDSQAILEQKKLNRDTSLRAIQLEAQNVYGQQGQQGAAGADSPNSWSTEEKQYYLQSGGDPSVFPNDLSTSLNGSFQTVAANNPPGEKAGQCAHFVNQNTGMKMGDSYASKAAYINPSIKIPQKGDVFIMPVQGSPYGHTGFVAGITYKSNGQPDQVIAYDSNWYEKSKPETVAVHKIPYSDVAGYARPNIA
jgi:hypothetical protein